MQHSLLVKVEQPLPPSPYSSHSEYESATKRESEERERIRIKYNLPIIRQSKTHPNVILILADDLGYGDLGFAPFDSDLMRAVETPNLKRLAKQGKVFTNFHAGSPICSPSRVAIMTGLFPWRVGVDFIYSQDPKKVSID